ncbi:hypothetical protein CRG98_041303 [Punica granatum]|uniref:Uncharacterized protein n=1 Tax=Punica granatum TaxID=22663 RepID=A0A2I0I2V5_PUNGR|nr:hypothetical protein CRG98_041303 [Punica granatum]
MLQETRARWLDKLAVQESKLSLGSRPGKVARGTSGVVWRTCGAGKWARTSQQTRQGCNMHERGGSANLPCRKVNSHGLANPARLEEARARWLGELAVQESKLARVSKPSKVARGTSGVVWRTCGAGKWARTSQQTRQGCNMHERGGSANLPCRKVNSHRLGEPARLQEARSRWLANLRCKKVSWHGLADRAMLQEAQSRWLGELAVQEKLARLQEALARWLGELAVQESKLARVRKLGKVATGTSKVVP